MSLGAAGKSACATSLLAVAAAHFLGVGFALFVALAGQADHRGAGGGAWCQQARPGARPGSGEAVVGNRGE